MFCVESTIRSVSTIQLMFFVWYPLICSEIIKQTTIRLREDKCGIHVTATRALTAPSQTEYEATFICLSGGKKRRKRPPLSHSRPRDLFVDRKRSRGSTSWGRAASIHTEENIKHLPFLPCKYETHEHHRLLVFNTGGRERKRGREPRDTLAGEKCMEYVKTED